MKTDIGGGKKTVINFMKEIDQKIAKLPSHSNKIAHCRIPLILKYSKITKVNILPKSVLISSNNE